MTAGPRSLWVLDSGGFRLAEARRLPRPPKVTSDDVSRAVEALERPPAIVSPDEDLGRRLDELAARQRRLAGDIADAIAELRRPVVLWAHLAE